MKTVPLLLIAMVLASCGDAGSGDRVAAADDDGRVECALDGAAAFEPICTLERTPGEQGLTLTIRAPDGGFRRLLVTADGRGVVAADGAAPAIVSVISPDRIEVAIADDRYRLPATVQSGE